MMTVSAPDAGGTVSCTTGCALAAEARDALQRLAQAVATDDLDAAIVLGLLDYVSPFSPENDGSAPHDDAQRAPCALCLDQDSRVGAARDARLRALAARERHRAREARLRRRVDARASRRAAAQQPAAPVAASAVNALEPAGPAHRADPQNARQPPPAAGSPTAVPPGLTPGLSPGLSPAAAAALARAKARAAARGAKE